MPRSHRTAPRCTTATTSASAPYAASTGRVTLPAQVGQRPVQIGGVPQRDAVQYEAERAELVLHAPQQHTDLTETTRDHESLTVDGANALLARS